MADSSIEINGSTQLYALIGSPVGHSLSPRIHNTSFKTLSINAAYVAFDVRDLTGAMDGLKSLGIQGFNVTVPHKLAVMEFLDEISPEAKTIGSVNTVVKKGTKWIGHNTDAAGFSKTLEPFREKVVRQKVLVLGAGGSARAVVYALLTDYDVTEIIIFNRTKERALHLIKELAIVRPDVQLTYVSFEELQNFDVKLAINATSVGLGSGECPVGPHFFRSGMIAYDLIYDPMETTFLRYARASGAFGINGFEMLIAQAASTFEMWTQKAMPVEEVIKNLSKKVDNH